MPGTERSGETAGVTELRADVDLPWLPDDLVAGVASANHAPGRTPASARRLATRTWSTPTTGGSPGAADVAATLFGVPMITTFHGTERGRHGGHLAPGQPIGHQQRRVVAGDPVTAG